MAWPGQVRCVSRLLASGPDDVSGLSGAQLVAQKAKELVVTALDVLERGGSTGTFKNFAGPVWIAGSETFVEVNCGKASISNGGPYIGGQPTGFTGILQGPFGFQVRGLSRPSPRLI